MGTAQKAKADEDTQTARKLADQYQPMIIMAEKDKRSSDFKFQEFARLTQEADSLQTRADALLSRADTIDGLIQSTQNDLSGKRKEFDTTRTVRIRRWPFLSRPRTRRRSCASRRAKHGIRRQSCRTRRAGSVPLPKRV